MSIDMIPAGMNAIATGSDSSSKVLRALVDMASDEGTRYGNTICAVKDAEADNVRTVKDAEANLERSIGDKFVQTVQDVKDSEARLHKDAGDKFINVVQDVKDAESRLLKDAGDKFIQTIQDVKEAEFEGAKSDGRTRELFLEKFAKLQYENADLKYHGKENQREMEKVMYHNELRNVEHFGKQALLTEKLALQNELHQDRLAAVAAAKAAECCCELREAIRADGDRTRALVNAQEVQNLRDSKTKLEIQVAALYAAGKAPVSPV